MQTNINDLAKELEILKKHNSKLFFNKISSTPPNILGEVLLELPVSSIEDLLETIHLDIFVSALSELESDDATDLIQTIEEIDQEKANYILSKLDLKDQIDINKLKQYDEEQAGAYMQKELLKANYNDNISDFIKRIKNFDIDLDTVTQLYIVNNKNQIIMSLPITKLLLVDIDKTFQEIWPTIPTEYIPHTVTDTQDIQEVINMFSEYDLSSLPVVDNHKNILGRITYDDIYDLIEENATEQMYHLAGVDDEAEEDTNIIKTIQTRFNWLFLNLITAILASIAIGFFSDVIDKIVALAILMPIVASMGGNSGTQSLAVTVRQIALGDIDKTNAYATLKKEFLISLSNSFVFAIIMGSVTYVWFHSLTLSVVIGVSMIVNLIIAGIFGALIPLVLKSLKIDPAIGSSVILTTITDIVGFVSFLALAKYFIL